MLMGNSFVFNKCLFNKQLQSMHSGCYCTVSNTYKRGYRQPNMLMIKYVWYKIMVYKTT